MAGPAHPLMAAPTWRVMLSAAMEAPAVFPLPVRHCSYCTESACMAQMQGVMTCTPMPFKAMQATAGQADRTRMKASEDPMTISPPKVQVPRLPRRCTSHGEQGATTTPARTPTSVRAKVIRPVSPGLPTVRTSLATMGASEATGLVMNKVARQTTSRGRLPARSRRSSFREVRAAAGGR